MSIIHVSPLLLLLLLPRPLCGYHLIDEVRGGVAAEESRFYALESSQNLVVVLVSDEGDADMYASTTHKHPSFDENEYSSTSCGLDMLVVPATIGGTRRKVHIGVHGHIRHANTSYRLFVFEPSEEDVKRYQVWEWDPESNRIQLLIDVDPLILVNDPQLHVLLDRLLGIEEELTGKPAEYTGGVKTVVEWVGYVLLEILKIVLEVLL